MGLQTETSSNKIQTADDASGGSTDGYQVGQTTSSYVGFYGTAPVQRQTGVSAITDTSGGAASATTGLQALTSSYNSGIIANAISTLAQQINNIKTALSNLGLHS